MTKRVDRINISEVLISTNDNVVILELLTQDVYTAAVLKDDIVERLTSGEKVRFNLMGLGPQEPEEVKD